MKSDPDRQSPRRDGPKSEPEKQPSSFAGLAASLLVIAIVTFALLAILDAFTRGHGVALAEKSDKPANLSNYSRVVRAASQNAIVVIDEGE
jgi:hypothetical protein